MKAYLQRSEKRTGVDIVDYWFHANPENVLCWGTEEEAEIERKLLDRLCITITSADGETHVCKDFTVEQQAPERFVIFCTAPFIGVASGLKSDTAILKRLSSEARARKLLQEIQRSSG